MYIRVLSYMLYACKILYFQPERIDPWNSHKGYDIRSDVWSLGITLVKYLELNFTISLNYI